MKKLYTLYRLNLEKPSLLKYVKNLYKLMNCHSSITAIKNTPQNMILHVSHRVHKIEIMLFFLFPRH